MTSFLLALIVRITAAVHSNRKRCVISNIRFHFSLLSLPTVAEVDRSACYQAQDRSIILLQQQHNNTSTFKIATSRQTQSRPTFGSSAESSSF